MYFCRYNCLFFKFIFQRKSNGLRIAFIWFSKKSFRALCKFHSNVWHPFFPYCDQYYIVKIRFNFHYICVFTLLFMYVFLNFIYCLLATLNGISSFNNTAWINSAYRIPALCAPVKRCMLRTFITTKLARDILNVKNEFAHNVTTMKLCCLLKLLFLGVT